MRSLLLSRRWLLRHLLAAVLIVVCLRLGWWQWDRARAAGGTVQNFGYALQWPFFGAFVGYAWYRMLRLDLRPSDDVEPPTTATTGDRPTVQVRRRYEPTVTPDAPPDAELDAYNDYLASLNGHPRAPEPADRAEPRRTTP